MRRTVELAAVFTLAATLTMSGCSVPQMPTQVGDDQPDSFFASEPAPGFAAMRRNAPLSSDLSVTRMIGAQGGRIRLDEAGVTFVVPAGALEETTEITLTALAGQAVAFEFAPHGLEFMKSASIQIDAAETEAEHLLARALESRSAGIKLDRFMGVYFQGNSTLGVEPLENIQAFLLDESIVFSIDHFSGYVCASG